MSDEFRPDVTTAERASDAAAMPLQRETDLPRRDRWLMPLIAAGCTLAGVALGFVLGQRTALTAAAPAMAERSLLRSEANVVIPDIHFDHDDDDSAAQFFAFNFHGHERHGFMAPMPPIPPVPPMPPMMGGPRELVVDGCNGDDDEERCTTIIKRKHDGSVVIVKTPAGRR